MLGFFSSNFHMLRMPQCSSNCHIFYKNVKFSSPLHLPIRDHVLWCSQFLIYQSIKSSSHHVFSCWMNRLISTYVSSKIGCSIFLLNFFWCVYLCKTCKFQAEVDSHQYESLGKVNSTLQEKVKFKSLNTQGGTLHIAPV